jgi:hypothetical protein
MGSVLEILNRIASLTGKLFNLIRGLSKEALLVLLAVTTAIAIVSTSLLVALDLFRSQHRKEVALPGGLDLVRYCNSFGLSQNSDRFCFQV